LIQDRYDEKVLVILIPDTGAILILSPNEKNIAAELFVVSGGDASPGLSGGDKSLPYGGFRNLKGIGHADRLRRGGVYPRPLINSASILVNILDV
jgi:hypothetical protein